jgi:hypothetical protein
VTSRPEFQRAPRCSRFDVKRAKLGRGGRLAGARAMHWPRRATVPSMTTIGVGGVHAPHPPAARRPKATSGTGHGARELRGRRRTQHATHRSPLLPLHLTPTIDLRVRPGRARADAPAAGSRSRHPSSARRREHRWPPSPTPPSRRAGRRPSRRRSSSHRRGSHRTGTMGRSRRGGDARAMGQREAQPGAGHPRSERAPRGPRTPRRPRRESPPGRPPVAQTASARASVAARRNPQRRRRRGGERPGMRSRRVPPQRAASARSTWRESTARGCAPPT